MGVLDQELTAGTAGLARQAGCPCTVVSSLPPAIAIADADVSAVSPVVRLLSELGIGIALAVAAAAGVFAVRRRRVEAALAFSRGEHVASFSARTALEALLADDRRRPRRLRASRYALTGTFAPNGTLNAHDVPRPARGSPRRPSPSRCCC